MIIFAIAAIVFSLLVGFVTGLIFSLTMFDYMSDEDAHQ